MRDCNVVVSTNYVVKLVCETHVYARGLLTSNVGQFVITDSNDHHPMGVGFRMCIDFATPIVITNLRFHSCFSMATDCITVVAYC